MIFAALFYFSAAVLIIGVAWKIASYARTPAPLLIPTTPAPTTLGGVVFRMVREVTLFESLFKANLWTWAASIVFHGSLALVLIRHLRYFIEPVWTLVALAQPFGLYAGLTMVLGLAGLWTRRIFVERIRYISTPSDHLILVLLLAIATSGLCMKFFSHTDIIGVKNFFLGVMHFNLQSLPDDGALYVHLLLVASLALIFPFSKLLHAPGVFFSPSRNQIDNPREKRHLAPWAAKLEK
jgi:nitrate reductase gamma subunit